MNAWERLYQLMHREGFNRIAYIYRLNSDGKSQKPFLTKLYPDDRMLDVLRDEYGGGDFRLLIREGRKLVYSGEISIIEPSSLRS